MKRWTWMAILAVFAGCKAFEKKPPPVNTAPPEIETPAPEPEPVPAAPPDLPGTWISIGASGPGSGGVLSVTLSLGSDGRYAGSLLLHESGVDRFVTLEGRWSRAADVLAVELSDGRKLTWPYRFENSTLVLAEGESELRLRKSEGPSRVVRFR